MKDIKYMLRGVSIEQFATLFEPSTSNININVNIPVKTNYAEHAVAIGANVQFLEGDRAFIVAEVFCHYLIEDDCWKALSNDDSKEVILPKGFINNLAGIAVSTARGVICAKTEKTPFAQFFLPILTITPNIGKDLIIPKPE